MAITCVSWFLTWASKEQPKESERVNVLVSKQDTVSAIVTAKTEQEAWDQVAKAGNTVEGSRSATGHSYTWNPEVTLRGKS